jgi:hypothetical protein
MKCLFYNNNEIKLGKSFETITNESVSFWWQPLVVVLAAAAAVVDFVELCRSFSSLEHRRTLD